MDPISTSLQNMQRYSFNSQASPRDNQTATSWIPRMASVSLNEEDEESGKASDNGTDPKRSYVVISGGTAANDFVHAFGTDCAFVLPVSDDGGSSSEILRVLGGPAIGDIRSRLIRLITTPDDSGVTSSTSSTAHPQTRPLAGVSTTQAVHDLFAHRFPKDCSERQAREMWADLVEGKGPLWRDVPADRRECIRSFFVHFNTLILRRSHKHFSFRNCSVGNAFLAAARDMLGGLPGAIFMFRAVSDSQGSGAVLPVILTNQRITIAARLENGQLITGQCEISHPAPTPASQDPAPLTRSTTPSNRHRRRKDSMSFATGDSSSSEDDSSGSELDLPYEETGDDCLAPVGSQPVVTKVGGSLPRSTGRQGSPWRESPLSLAMAAEEQDRSVVIKPPKRATRIKREKTIPEHGEEMETVDDNAMYTKGTAEVALPSRIERVFYINDYGQEIKPDPNSEMLQHLAQKEVLVYSCGSLWTSIVPCLALRGVASAIAKSMTLRAKVLLLNSNNDRETDGYTAVDYVNTIVRTLNESKRSKRGNSGEIMMPGVKIKTHRNYETSRLVTHLVYLEKGKVEVDLGQLQALGVTVIRVPADAGSRFTTRTVAWAMEQVNRVGAGYIRKGTS